MILPQTYLGTLLVLILGLFCLGLWANTFKLAGKLRFELYYFDFAIGMGIAAVIYGLTFGSMGFDGFSLVDDVMQVHMTQRAEALAAGAVFNLATMMLMGAVSIAGMSVAFPVALGSSLVVGVLLANVGHRGSNVLFLAAGCVLVVSAIVTAAVAYKSLLFAGRAAKARPGKKVRGPGSFKGLTLSIVSGLLTAATYPLLNRARAGDVGLGPYSLMFLFAAGVFLSTFVYSLFFMNLPVQGEPLEILDYLKLPVKRHLFGLAGGILSCSGSLAVFVAARTAPEVQLERAIWLALSNGGTLIAGLCGLLAWNEFQAGAGKPKVIAFTALLLFAGGLGALSVALS